jgi:predicted ArsR family transcriptional regulator
MQKRKIRNPHQRTRDEYRSIFNDKDCTPEETIARLEKLSKENPYNPKTAHSTRDLLNYLNSTL